MKKTVEMKKWVPEAINTSEENNLLIRGVINDLKGSDPGANAVSVGGDTLIFAAIGDDGALYVYEATIRRASVDASDENLPGFGVPSGGLLS